MRGMDEHPAFEVHGHRDNGEVFSIAVLGRLPETEAFLPSRSSMPIAGTHPSVSAAFPSRTTAPWFDDEVQIVAQLVPTIEGRV